MGYFNHDMDRDTLSDDERVLVIEWFICKTWWQVHPLRQFDTLHNVMKILDYFITSDTVEIIHNNQFWPSNLSKHAMIITSINLPTHATDEIVEFFYYKSFWYGKTFFWDAINIYRTNEMIEALYDIILRMFEEFVSIRLKNSLQSV